MQADLFPHNSKDMIGEALADTEREAMVAILEAMVARTVAMGRKIPVDMVEGMEVVSLAATAVVKLVAMGIVSLAAMAVAMETRVEEVTVINRNPKGHLTSIVSALGLAKELPAVTKAGIMAVMTVAMAAVSAAVIAGEMTMMMTTVAGIRKMMTTMAMRVVMMAMEIDISINTAITGAIPECFKPVTGITLLVN